jgi:hypothetical protein
MVIRLEAEKKSEWPTVAKPSDRLRLRLHGGVQTSGQKTQRVSLVGEEPPLVFHPQSLDRDMGAPK